MHKKTILIVIIVIIAFVVVFGATIYNQNPEEIELNPDEDKEELVGDEKSSEDEDGEEEIIDEETGENSVNLYFLKMVDGQEVVTPVEKDVTTKSDNSVLAEAILLSLLAGTDEEGFSTAINEKTELLSLNIENGVAIANFSSEIEPGGGSAWVNSIREQITKTLMQFDFINEVDILVEGEEDRLQP